MSHTSLATRRGLNRDLPAPRLYEKVRRGEFPHALQTTVLFRTLAYLNGIH